MNTPTTTGGKRFGNKDFLRRGGKKKKTKQKKSTRADDNTAMLFGRHRFARNTKFVFSPLFLLVLPDTGVAQSSFAGPIITICRNRSPSCVVVPNKSIAAGVPVRFRRIFFHSHDIVLLQIFKHIPIIIRAVIGHILILAIKCQKKKKNSSFLFLSYTYRNGFYFKTCIT